MPQNLSNLFKDIDARRHATDAGTQMHKRMQSLRVHDGELTGPADIIAHIKARPDIARFFAANSRPEVPIVGTIRGNFISRRIDRMCVNDDERTVLILDYKTDTDRDTYREKYIYQLREYRELVAKIYPGYTVETYILWLHDWTLERI